MKLFLLCLVLLSSKSFAYERSFFQKADGEHILVEYQEEGRWFLKEYLVKKDSLQKEIFSKSFALKYQLHAYKKNHYKKLNTKSAATYDFVATELNDSVIWEVKNQWNLDWERKYAQWIAENFDKSFFVKYQITTDCADVAFALRWIFARIHFLPAANTLAGTHILFTQDSMKKAWAKLPTDPLWHKDQRFRAALDYLKRYAFTGTLVMDTYPIEITREAFTIGTIHLTGHHTMIISNIVTSGDDAPIWKLSSTVPAQIRELMLQPMLDAEAIPVEDGGILHMRWPIKHNGRWALIAKNEMPYYSLEQYDPQFVRDTGSFTLSVIKSLNIDFEPRSLIQSSAETSIQMLKDRVPIVREGYEFCRVNDCSEGSANYDLYSTPSRDERIAKQFATIDDLVDKFKKLDSTLPQLWEKLQQESVVDIEGHSKKLGEYRILLTTSLMSYDPSDEISLRWALEKNDQFHQLKNIAQNYFQKRKVLVDASRFCIDSAQCEFDTKNWNELNTFELDKTIKVSVYDAFDFLILRYGKNVAKEQLGRKLDGELRRIPAFISDPRFSTDERWGVNPNRFIPVPADTRFIEVSENYFLQDNQLINLNNDDILRGDLEGVALVTARKDLLHYRQEENTLELIDAETGSLLDSLSLEKRYDIINWLGEDVLIMLACRVMPSDCAIDVFQIYPRIEKQLSFEESLPDLRLQFVESVYSEGKNNDTPFLNGLLPGIFYYSDKGKLTKKIAPAGYKIESITHFSDWINFTYTSIDSGKLPFLTRIHKTSKSECRFDYQENTGLLFIGQDYFEQFNPVAGEYKFYRWKDNCQYEVITEIQGNWAHSQLIGKTLYILDEGNTVAYYNNELIELDTHIITKIFHKTEKGVYYANPTDSKMPFYYDLATKTTKTISQEDIIFDCRERDFQTCFLDQGGRFRKIVKGDENILYSYKYYLDKDDHVFMQDFSSHRLQDIIIFSDNNSSISMYDPDFLKALRNIQEYRNYEVFSVVARSKVLVH